MENAITQALSTKGRDLFFFRKDDPRMAIHFVTYVEGKLCSIEVKSGSNRRCDSLNRAVRNGMSGMMFETRDIFTDDKAILCTFHCSPSRSSTRSIRH